MPEAGTTAWRYSAMATVAEVSGNPGSTLEGVGLTFTYYPGSTRPGLAEFALAFGFGVVSPKGRA